MTTHLQVDVFVSPAVPTKTGHADPNKQMWSPISSTLIQGATTAVLADTPITIEQSNILADWIEKTAPGKTLKYIFVTHAHGDHFFGAPVLLKRFPGARLVATKAVAEGCMSQIGGAGAGIWNAFFPEQLAPGQVAPEPLPAGEFEIDGHLLYAHDVTHSDTHASSFLHSPSLGLVVAGDIVYGDCYQFLAEANSSEKRRLWIKALDEIAALKPNIVVPGHKRATQIDGAYLIEATKDYIFAFEEELEKSSDAVELEAAIKKRYPQRWNDYILERSCQAAFG
jgi:glyoxylase-like metal-dependent hydrolase (beta-lactamase superfamily II)